MVRLLVTLTWESDGNFNIAAPCHFEIGSLTLSSLLFAQILCKMSKSVSPFKICKSDLEERSFNKTP